MSEQNDTTVLSEETQRLAAIGRGEEVAPVANPAPAAPQRPENVPEKFWDAEAGTVRTDALLKSYLELEKTRAAPDAAPDPTDPAPVDEAPGGPQDEPTDEKAPAGAVSADLLAAAQAEFAETQDLGEETRQKFLDAGIDAQTLDTYLAGVKALQEKLDNQIFDMAGGRDAYMQAVDWARENWSDAQIAKFDAALNDPDLRELSVAGLMAAAKITPPTSEGNLTVPNGAIVASDVYTDKDQFLRDLAAADLKGDLLARKEAVQRLERSKKAGTLSGVTPRSGTARFG